MKNRIQSLITLLIIVVFVLSSSSISSAQQIKQFKVQNATLEECLKQIEKQTGLGYLSKGEDIRNVKGITYSVQNQDVKEVLKSIFAKSGFTFEINNGVILVIKEQIKPLPANKPQGKSDLTLKLKILDESTNEPVTGASALIRQFGVYGIADAEGNAIIKNLPSGVSLIEVQMLGYESYSSSINIDKDRDLVIKLKQTSLELEEVVVTATKSAAGTSTSSKIGRQAMDHLQATSLKRYNAAYSRDSYSPASVI
jgi:hypothetical protein